MKLKKLLELIGELKGLEEKADSYQNGQPDWDRERIDEILSIEITTKEEGKK